MPDRFAAKLADFQQWSVIACQRMGEGAWADALTNMRKAGEAACKVILLTAYPEKRAHEEISGRGYQDLMDHITRNGLVASDVVNCLKTFQILGNKATHDSAVAATDAEMGLAALQKFSQWLYRERSKIPVPEAVVLALRGADPLQRHSRELAEREEVLRILRKETEEKEKALRARMEREQQDAAEKARVVKELEDGRSRMAQVEQETKQMRAMVEAQMVRAQTPAIAIAEIPPTMEPKSGRPVKPLVLVLFVGALLAGIMVIVKVLSDHGGTAEQDTTKDPTIAPEVTRVIIMRFPVLQDNPTIRIDMEGAISLAMRDRIAELGLQALVQLDTSSGSTFTQEQARSYLLDKGAHLLIMGEIYEPSGTDSGRVEIRYAMRRTGAVVVSRGVGAPAFRVLTDQSAQRIIAATAFLLEQAIANHRWNDGDIRGCLDVLNRSTPVTTEEKYDRHFFSAQCQEKLGDPPRAVREARACLRIYPGWPHSEWLMGHMLLFAGDTATADSLLRIVIAAQPDNPDAAVDLAIIMADPKHPERYNARKAHELLQKAVERDSVNALAWRTLGLLDLNQGRRINAMFSYLRAVHFDSANTDGRKHLAQLLAFTGKNPEEAVRILSPVLRADSSDNEALFIMAEIFSKTRLHRYAEAEHLYARGRAPNQRAEAAELYGAGNAAYQRGDLRTARSKFEAAWALDSSSVEYGNALGEACTKLRDEACAFRVFFKCWQLDSLSAIKNFNLGQMYFHGVNGQRDAAVAGDLLSRAVHADPFDTLALEMYGNILVEMERFDDAAIVLTRAQAMAPDRYAVNRGLAFVADAKGRLEEAEHYYLKALAAQQKDALVISNLAYLVMRRDPEHRMREALDYAERSVRLAPDDPHNRYVLSMVQLNTGDWANAAESYRFAISRDPRLVDPTVEGMLRKKGLW